MSRHLDERQLHSALDSDLSLTESDHLQVCQDCQRRLAELQNLHQALRSSCPRPSSDAHTQVLAQRFLNALDAPQPDPRRRWRHPLFQASALAATAAALVLIYLGLGDPLPQKLPELAASAATEAPAKQTPVASAVTGSTIVDAEPPVRLEPAPVRVAVPRGLNKSARSPRPEATRPVEVPPQPITATELAVAQLPAPEPIAEPAPAAAPALAVAPALAAAPAPPRDLAVEIQQQLSHAEDGTDVEARSLAFAELALLMPMASQVLEPQALDLLAQRIAALRLESPEDERAAFMACESALLARSYETAYRLCSTYIERFPSGPRARDAAYLAGAVAGRQLGDCQAAVLRYGQALTFSGLLQSRHDEAYLGRARCFLQLGQTQRARADLDMYLHKHPERRQSKSVQHLLSELGLPVGQP